MSREELLAMLRHAAKHYDMQHIAALNEMRCLGRLSDAEFRAKVTEILDAVLQVDTEIDEVIEAVSR